MEADRTTDEAPREDGVLPRTLDGVTLEQTQTALVTLLSSAYGRESESLGVASGMNIYEISTFYRLPLAATDAPTRNANRALVSIEQSGAQSLGGITESTITRMVPAPSATAYRERQARLVRAGGPALSNVLKTSYQVVRKRVNLARLSNRVRLETLNETFVAFHVAPLIYRHRTPHLTLMLDWDASQQQQHVPDPGEQDPGEQDLTSQELLALMATTQAPDEDQAYFSATDSIPSSYWTRRDAADTEPSAFASPSPLEGRSVSRPRPPGMLQTMQEWWYQWFQRGAGGNGNDPSPVPVPRRRMTSIGAALDFQYGIAELDERGNVTGPYTPRRSPAVVRKMVAAVNRTGPVPGRMATRQSAARTTAQPEVMHDIFYESVPGRTMHGRLALVESNDAQAGQPRSRTMLILRDTLFMVVQSLRAAFLDQGFVHHDLHTGNIMMERLVTSDLRQKTWLYLDRYPTEPRLTADGPFRVIPREGTGTRANRRQTASDDNGLVYFRMESPAYLAKIIDYGRSRILFSDSPRRPLEATDVQGLGSSYASLGISSEYPDPTYDLRLLCWRLLTATMPHRFWENTEIGDPLVEFVHDAIGGGALAYMLVHNNREGLNRRIRSQREYAPSVRDEAIRRLHDELYPQLRAMLSDARITPPSATPSPTPSPTPSRRRCPVLSDETEDEDSAEEDYEEDYADFYTLPTLSVEEQLAQRWSPAFRYRFVRELSRVLSGSVDELAEDRRPQTRAAWKAATRLLSNTLELRYVYRNYTRNPLTAREFPGAMPGIAAMHALDHALFDPYVARDDPEIAQLRTSIERRGADGPVVLMAMPPTVPSLAAMQRYGETRVGAPFSPSSAPTPMQASNTPPPAAVSRHVIDAMEDEAHAAFKRLPERCESCQGHTGRLVCKGCRKARYCSRDCQKIDWRRHHRHSCSRVHG